MLRRMATSVAAALTLVLSASLPALADHAEPDATLDGNVKSCAGIVDGAYWEKSADVPRKIRHNWWTVTFSSDNKWLDVKLTADGLGANAQLAVLVKGGPDTNLFRGQPGEDLTGLFAPAKSGKHPQISNYTICKVKQEAPPTEEPPTEEPPAEAPPTDNPPSDEGEPTPTPTATASKTPVPVPTSVPAGMSGPGSGFAVTVLGGLLIAILAAGAAVLGRRLAA